jgi:8-oxo-dGTP diphosphatase
MDDREPVNLRCTAMVLRDNAILLCRRSEEGDTWVLPGGTPRRGEGTAQPCDEK